jgi:thioredoxin 2
MASIVLSCASCGAKNRIPAARLSDSAVCGNCKTALPPPAQPLEVDEAAFDAIVSSARQPVLVDFWAAWCGPCRMAAPEVEKLAQETGGKALVLKVDTEAQPGLAARFQVQSIPNFVVFGNGRPVFQQAGLAPRAQMRQWLEQASRESVAGR